MVQPVRGIVLRFLKKLKIELPYDSAISLLGIYLDKTIIQKDICTLMFIVSLFRIGMTWKQSKCPLTDKWIKKMCVLYTRIQWNTTQPEKEQTNAICSNMDESRDYHTK